MRRAAVVSALDVYTAAAAAAAATADPSANLGKRRAGGARRKKFGGSARAAKMGKMFNFQKGVQERTVIATTTVQWSS